LKVAPLWRSLGYGLGEGMSAPQATWLMLMTESYQKLFAGGYVRWR